jgi:hypothetical protein
MGVREVNEALPTVSASPSLIGSKVVRLIRPPIEAPQAVELDETPKKSSRRLKFEALMAIAPEARTPEQEMFIRVFEHYGDNVRRLGMIG